MPPSGFHKGQVAHIRGFLASCATALQAESKANGETLNEALAREICDIERFMGANRSSDEAQAGLLKLVRTFYKAVSRCEPVSESDFEAAVTAGLDEVAQSILAIHVDPSRSAKPWASGSRHASAVRSLTR